MRLYGIFQGKLYPVYIVVVCGDVFKSEKLSILIEVVNIYIYIFLRLVILDISKNRRKIFHFMLGLSYESFF